MRLLVILVLLAPVASAAGEGGLVYTYEEKVEILKQAYHRLNLNDPPPEITGPPEDAVWPPLPAARPKVVRVADICSRHGRHKVVNGRSWRCR